VSFSGGFMNPGVFRGRLLRLAAVRARPAAGCTGGSVPVGRYWRSSPLVFWLEPRCQGARGSQEQAGMPAAMVKPAWQAISMPWSPGPG
jgi:hypothetical protein